MRAPDPAGAGLPGLPRGALTLTVLNHPRPGNRDGHAGDPDRSTVPGGAGLIGIAERVGWLGGTVETGPTPEGGYRLRVRLPLGPRTDD